MRYIPTTTGAPGRFNTGSRPPLEALPPELSDALRLRDRILLQQQEAQARHNQLATKEAEDAARRADDDTAAAAARAGKPIPPAKALAKLEADRADAARALTAQQTALVGITSEADDIASKFYWSNLEANQAERAKVRAQIEQQALELADAIEDAVAVGATFDWMQTGVLARSAQTWPTDVCDLARYGLDRANTTPIPIRGAIVRAALATLTED
jgi:hypothetical protein